MDSLSPTLVTSIKARWCPFFWVSCFGLVLLWSAPGLAWNPLLIGGRCSSSQGSCNTTIGNAGGAGACCDPRSSSIAACVQSNSCQGGTAYHWPSTVSWYFNPNGLAGGFAGKSDSAYEASLKAAWDAWSSPSCTSFRHTYAGRTTTKASTSDRKVVAFFANTGEWAQFGFGSSTLAVTRPATGNNGQIIDADIIFNPNPSGRKWGIHPNVAADEMDFQDVAAHEIGHALGFGHAHPKTSLMYFSVRGVGPVFAGLPQDEQDAVCATYPGNGTQPECQVDTDCQSKGACMACQGGKCVARQINADARSCQGCRSNADCGGLACVAIDGKMRCLQACSSGCCPSGTTCQTQSGQPLCVPSSNQCPTPTCTQDTECGPDERCVSGTCQTNTTPPNPCGDGTCDATTENCGNCPVDCACPTGQACQNNVCQSTPPPNACGNGACDIDKQENCTTCPQDCACAAGTICQNTICVNQSQGNCGDGTCGTGENCSTCPQDCACVAGLLCQGGACLQSQIPECSPTQPCPTGQICQAGTCVQSQAPECSDTQPCAAGAVCQNGRCVAGNPSTPAPGTVGGPCLAGGLCLAGALCFTQPSGQGICLQKVSGVGNAGLSAFRPRGFGCSALSYSPPSFLALLWLLLPFLCGSLRKR